MNDLYKKILSEKTAKGEMFETKKMVNSKGIEYTEYVNFPDSLKGYFEFGLMHADKDWLVYENERYTFKEVFNKAAQVANALTATGIKKGDKVAICMQNNPEYIFAYMGIVGMGAVCVPLNSWWVPTEVIYGLEHSDAKLVFGDSKRLQGLQSVKSVKKIITSYTPDKNFQSFKEFIDNHSSSWPDVSIDRNDDATIYYTSGSTGKPKGVLSSHKAVIATMFSWACYSSIFSEISSMSETNTSPLLSEDLAILLCIPLFHVTGSHAGLFMSILVGRKIVMMKKWDAEDALQLIDQEKISDVTGVPTQSWELLNHPNRNKYNLSSLKTLGAGGAPRPPEHVKLLDEGFEAKPGIGYGLSETNALGTLCNGEEYINNPSSAGRVVPPLTEIKIIDKKWNSLPEGDIGEVAIKSLGNMTCYWKNPEATSECMNDDGWIKTGDLGKFDGPLLYIVDRVKDMVIRGGENIACPEVEAAIYEHPDVLENCVFGIPDERLGEIPYAVVVLRDDSSLTEDDIISFLQSRLAAFKIPNEITLTKEKLPKLASGKFDKVSLRKNYQR